MKALITVLAIVLILAIATQASLTVIQENPPKLVIHDVRGDEPKSIELVEFLSENNISSYVLVIPSSVTPELTNLLKEYEDGTIIQHGYNHNCKTGSIMDDYSLALERVKLGKTTLESWRLYPEGFLAPCWVESEAMHKAVIDIYGYDMTDTIDIQYEYLHCAIHPNCEYMAFHPKNFEDLSPVKEYLLEVYK